MFPVDERDCQQYTTLPRKEALGVLCFSQLLAVNHIEHEQEDALFTFADGMRVYVKTTQTGDQPYQHAIKSSVERAQVIVFARMVPFNAGVVKEAVEFRGYCSRKSITENYKPTNYKGLHQAYRVNVKRFLPMTDLIDWMKDKYHASSKASKAGS